MNLPVSLLPIHSRTSKMCIIAAFSATAKFAQELNIPFKKHDKLWCVRTKKYYAAIRMNQLYIYCYGTISKMSW